jgi:putative selenate reductase
MADSKRITKDILDKLGLSHDFVKVAKEAQTENIRGGRAILAEKEDGSKDAARCLLCDEVCEICCEVCPNRANVSIMADGRAQVVHIDSMCNECGNCGIFCPHIGLPYKDKLTLFRSQEDFHDSANKGVLFINDHELWIRDESGMEFLCSDHDARLSKEYKAVINAIKENHGYLIP